MRKLQAALAVLGLSVAGVVGLWLWQAATPVQASGEPDAGKIITIGRAELVAVPDMATVVVGVSALEKTAAKAQAEIATQMASLRAALTKLGIPEQSIQTRNFNVGAEYDYNNGQRNLLGYRAQHELYIKLDNLSAMGQVLDTLVSAGASEVREVQFDLKDSKAKMQQALESAVRDARAKAEALAAGAGVKVIRIARIQDQSSGSSVVRPLRDAYGVMAAAKSEQSTQVAVGEITVRADVEVEFEFQ